MRIGGWAGKTLGKLGLSRSRSPAATSIRRWRRAPSTPPSGSVPMTTRSSASTRSRSSTTIRAGGRAAPTQPSSINLDKWNSLPKNYQAIVRAAAARGQRRATGALRRPQPGGAQAPGCQRHAASSVLAGDHGGLPEGLQRSERRDLGDQCRLQEGATTRMNRLPRRRLSVVAGRRIRLRHLHDPQPRKAVTD